MNLAKYFENVIKVLCCIFIFSNFGFSQVENDEVKSFLSRENRGLKATDIEDFEISSYHISAPSSLKHIYFHQRYKGISIFNTASSLHLRQNGTYFHSNLSFQRDIEASILLNIPKKQLTAVEGLDKVAEYLNVNVNTEFKYINNPKNPEQKSLIERNVLSLRDIPARLVYFPSFSINGTKSTSKFAEERKLELAWEYFVEMSDQLHFWHIIIDAYSGAIIYQKNLVITCYDESNHDNISHGVSLENNCFEREDIAKSNTLMVGGYRVFPFPIESPGHGVRQLINNPDMSPGSPFGWHDTNGVAGPEYTITRGNNTHTYEDGNNPGFSPNGGAGLVFDFPFNPVFTPNVDESEAAALTNLFYWTNLIHDVTYNHGFTEAAGNFQVNNYGRGGVGADDVMAEGQDGSGTCNANFATPPDGSRPRMQMYVCNSRDGDLDNLVIAHEYAHGISNRLTGGPLNVNCLNNAEQMGEGWSDWYGLVLTIEPGDVGANPRPVGTWLFGQAPNGPGIRNYPYSTDLTIDPTTYDAIKTRSVPHGVGTVWCAMLWDLTWKLIDARGFDPDLHNGTGGNNLALTLITEAMKLQPCSPGFIDGRNAILRADSIITGGEFTCDIWTCFARRGLGFSASQGSSASRLDGTEAFDIPPYCAALPPTMLCFDYTGSEQSWIVPAGVDSIFIEAWGAEGGSAYNNLSWCGNLDMGGNGGYASGKIAVTAGQTLYFYVGGRGLDGPGPGGFNGGGDAPLDPGSDPNTLASGGGASDVRLGGNSLTDRIIVAGGGGGAEWSGYCQEAGVGGGLIGGIGLGDSQDPSMSGGPGDQSAGGYAGFDPCGFFLNTPGALGVGGRATFYHSGAGGGGYYGGGGAGCDSHGGGGSSYIDGVVGGTTTPGVRTGNGSICISFLEADLTITCPPIASVLCFANVPAAYTTVDAFIAAGGVVTGGCAPITIIAVTRADTVRACGASNIVRTYRITDACGAFAECTHQINITDVNPPSIIPLPNRTVYCQNLPTDTARGTTGNLPVIGVNYLDNCGSVGLTASSTVAIVPGSCPNNFTLNRTWTFRDAVGCTSSFVHSITVRDTAGPVVSCTNITLSLPISGTINYDLSNLITSAVDACNSNPVVRVSDIRSFTCANVGAATAYVVSARDACGNIGRCVAMITVLDVTPPEIIGCPTKGVVINLGPGECEASWDAPQFMAMDNCPIAGLYTGTETLSMGCNLNQNNNNFQAGGATGVFFDVMNLSTAPIALSSVKVMLNITNGNTYRVYMTNNAVSFSTVINDATQWCQLAPDQMISPAINPPPSGRYLTKINLGASRIDTTYVCGEQVYDTVGVYKGVIQPGQTRGIALYGINGGGFYYTNGIAPCNTTIQGNGVLGIDVRNGRSTRGNAIPFNQPISFSVRMFNGDLCYLTEPVNTIPVKQTCGLPYGPGCYFPIGCTTLCYEATDASGNKATCTFDVCVKEFTGYTNVLACNDLIQVSLDDSCKATIYSDMILEGGPYRCYDDYIVEVRDWVTNVLVDRCTNEAGPQIDCRDIGHEFKVTIRDPLTGNSCWGKVIVEDKLAPRITCPADTCVPCHSSIDPGVLGLATVVECLSGTCTPVYGCNSYSLSYKDIVDQGNCALGYDRRITRIWTAIDASGNKGTCTQIITVGIGTLETVTVPSNYDGLEEDMLACDKKIDKSKNINPHMINEPECLDGYLLDSAIFLANPANFDWYDWPLASDGLTLPIGRRVPRTLGWNCIDDVTDKNYGHPSPDPVYYPQHPRWDPIFQNCWPANRHIMWIGTGRPGSDCRNLGTVYEDVIIPLATAGCDAGSVGCYKVLRQWTVLDWCTGEIGGHSQIIKVADVEGPKVLYPDTVIVNMEVWTCTGRWEVPKPWITDNCSNEIHYSVEVTEGTVLGDEQTGYVVVDMPIGVQEGYIVATDCCGNITKKLVKLNVLDNVPPNCNTRKNTVITLASNQSTGEALGKLYAKDLDEGSRDNCSPHVFFKVIRMEELINTRNGRRPPFDNRVSCNGINGDDDPGVFAPGNQVYFDDFTKFCCADAGKTIMVVLRVFDKDPGAGPIHPNRFESIFDLEGHFSDCMVEVDIQDKQPPVVVAPPDMVVSCWYWFDPSESALEDPNNGTFGKLVTDLSSRKKVATLDLVCHQYCESNIHDYPGGRRGRLPLTSRNEGDIACDYYWTKFDTAHLDRKYELAWGFDGYALGTCAVTPTINASDNRDCGQGLITRTFSVAPGISAVQQIWVVDCDPFWVATACDQLDDIFWPDCQQLGSSIIGCGARDWSPNNPSTGGWAKVEHGGDDNCALIAIEYDDEIFRIEPDACIKIIRTWTVLDWCQYDPFDPNWKGSGRWTHTHVIKVRDEDAPVVTCTVGLCETQGLATIDPRTGLCLNHITLTATAYDSCSPEDWLKWEYKIDAFNDGKGVHAGYDFRVGSLTKKEFAAGDTALVNHNPYADDNKNPFDASGTYPVGVHKIKWFVEDGCGNIAVCETLFEVKDCKAPTPYCRFGVITVVMPSSGCITIWASDFDAGSYDNCTRQSNLHLTIEGEDSLTICCQDFIDKKADDELVIPIKMCVEDEEGNKDCCTTTLVVQDPQGVCPNGGSLKGKITGEIKTETGKATTSVDVDLMNNGQLKTEMSTVNDGKYAFYSLDLGLNYEIKPSRNDDPLNGVTTADIVKMQKHILGQEELNSPYKLIAADVNRSQSITAADISEIRKLILGTTERFKSVPSWVFVPTEHVFADRTQPWNYPVSSGMLMNKKENQVDFISIKMGDVNSTVTAGLQGSSSRTSGSMNMEIMDKAVEAGEIHKVEFKSSDFNNISGYQFTVKFDASAISFEGVEAGALKTTEGNFGLSRVNNGIITTSWNSSKGESYSADQVLFTLVFRANKGVQIGQAITINSEVTAAEAYDATLETKAVRLNVRTDRGVVETGVFELNQNEPNPFNKQTTVTFNLPNASPATLTMYDVTGKVLRVYEIEGLKGLNTKVINKSELNGNGVIYYQLDAANFTATKRMIVIE